MNLSQKRQNVNALYNQTIKTQAIYTHDTRYSGCDRW